MRNIVAYCIMTKKHYTKVARGKSWKLQSTEEKIIDKQCYENIVNAKSFFTGLGGRETHTKAYTTHGYVVITINSVRPDGLAKSVYEFDFDNVTDNKAVE